VIYYLIPREEVETDLRLRNTFAEIGSRMLGYGGGNYTILPPSWEGVAAGNKMTYQSST
jgi:hypothetical protein